MKKVKNNRIFKYILILFLILLLSLGIEFFAFQFKLITLNKEESGNHEIVDYVYEDNDLKKEIIISMKDRYVNKLRVLYDTSTDVPVHVTYVWKDDYGNDQESNFDDVLNWEVDEQITNFDKKINSIKISWDKDSSLDIEKIWIDNSVHFNFFRIFFVFMSLVILWILISFYKSYDHVKNIHKYFIFIGLILGIILITLQPSTTFYSWDDQIHFKNVYELIGGDFDWKTGEFSMIDYNAFGRGSIQSLEEQVQQMEYINQDQVQNYHSYGGRFLTYNKIAYLPSAFGFYLCKILHLPFNICFKAGKLMNLVAYLFIMGYAIKISKVGKLLLTVIGLIPTSIFLACQYAYDPAVTAGLILGIVCLINWFVDKDFKVDFKNFLIFILAMMYGCFPKAIYAPLMLLFLFIPKKKFKDKKQCILVKSGVFVICMLLMYTFIIPTVTNTMASDTRGGNTSVAGQLKLILKYPMGYINVLKNTMVANFFYYFFSSGALTNFSYFGEMRGNSYYLFIILLLFVTFTEKQEYSFKWWQKGLYLLFCLGIILLIWTALYLSFTPVGLNTINGVQPRYFIPLLYLFLICFQFNKIKINIPFKVYNLIVLMVPAICFLISVYQMILLNYCM